MTDLPDRLAPASLVVSSGRPDRVPGAPVNVPVDLSSTYAVTPGSLGYGRYENATWSAFEQVLGELEGGTALVYASGMAAVSAALTLLPPQGALVAPSTPYNTTAAVLGELGAAGRELRLVDGGDTEALLAALDGAGAVWLESPTNPLLQACDLPAVVAAARKAGLLVCCDNTLATPLLQRPLQLGADVVVHSVTKYLSGHADVVLGATVCRSDARGAGLHERLYAHRARHGAVAGPAETWLALRGLRTLHVRLERACANAAELARRLRGHPAVGRVRYPGWGAMLAVEVRGSAEAADRVVAACRLWLGATSLGGVESLVERRRRYPGESPLVPESLLRLSVGIEDVEDLWRDLDEALRSADGVRPARASATGT